MKKVLFIALALGLCASCVTPTPTALVEKKSNYYGLDLAKYSKEGFLVSSSDYYGEYEPLKIVKVDFIPQKECEMNIEHLYNYSTKTWYNDTTFSDDCKSKRPWTIQEAIDDVVEKGTDIGANAIMNLNYYYTENKTLNVSGVYIKRK